MANMFFQHVSPSMYSQQRENEKFDIKGFQKAENNEWDYLIIKPEQIQTDGNKGYIP